MNAYSVFNVRGLKGSTIQSKVPYIADVLHESNQLFIALTETWLHKHKDAELDIEGYSIFRDDRKRPGKNITIMVKCKIEITMSFS